MAENNFDLKKFYELTFEVCKTQYYLDNQEDCYKLQDIMEDYEEDKENGFSNVWEFDYYIDAVEELVYCDESVQFSRELAQLVDYVYKLAIEAGDANRTNDYGIFFYTGRYGYQDFDKALKYYKEAERLGCEITTENLGYIYYYGRTGEIDYKNAYLQFAKASTLYDRPISTYKIGDMYKNGYYVERSPYAAFKLYKKAEKLLPKHYTEIRLEAEAVADVYFRLGDCYHKGIGTSIDLIKALTYFQKAQVGFILRLKSGDYLIKKMLKASIDRQNEIMQEISTTLPDMEWAKLNTGYNTI